jgi:AcrR family transcriptional regulator
MDVAALPAGGVVRRPPFGSNPTVGERGSDTQRRILEAALDVFGEVGFAEARVELITERAGCSRPAFYQYFSSKDDVFWALAGRLGHEMVDLAGQLGTIAPDTAGRDALAAWIVDFMALYDVFAPVFLAFQAAARDHGSLAASSQGTSDRTALALLRAFGIRRSRRSGALAGATVAVLIRCSFYANAFAGDGLDRRRLAESLATTVHRLLAGPIEGVNVDERRGRRRGAKPAAAPAVADEDRSLRPRGERTRQRLLEAGAAVLPERGYHDTRVDDLVEAAGVSHGTFYRYFENKDDLFRVLAEQASTEMVALLDELVAIGVDGDVEELRAWAQAWFEATRTNGGVISTWQEMRVDEELAAFSQAIAASVLSRLVALLDQRPFGDPEVDAFALQAVLERMPYSVYTLRFSTTADATEAMLTFLRRGFFAVADAGG